MSQQRRNIELVRGAYEGFARGDVAAVFALLTPDSVIIEAAGLPYTGTFRGVEGMQQLLGKMMEAVEAPELHPLDFFHDDGERVVARIRMTGRVRATGRLLDTELLELWHMRDEKVVEMRPFYFDKSAFGG